MRITGYRLQVFDCPLDRPISDSRSRWDSISVGILALETDTEHVGLGFFTGRPLPPLGDLYTALTAAAATVLGVDPFIWRNLHPDPAASSMFRQPFDQAMWDLQAKGLGIPLYRLLGGTNTRVPAYASGLDFDLDVDEAVEFFGQAADRGFRAFKAKVGYPDRAYEIDRLLAIEKRVGKGSLLMVDANEAWTPREAIARIHGYQAAGLQLFWVEDPCPRDDFGGYRELVDAVPFVRINRGESVDLAWKKRVLDDGAVGILNVAGHFGDGWLAAWLALDRGIPLTVGNTPCSLGVHLAASIPGEVWMEHSFLAWDVLIEEPVRVEQGYAFAPDRPGHGLAISKAAFEGKTSAVLRQA